MTPSGERLKQMTGVAAILKFALPGLDDVEEPNESGSERDSDELSDVEYLVGQSHGSSEDEDVGSS
jgi:hypothetical protein